MGRPLADQGGTSSESDSGESTSAIAMNLQVKLGLLFGTLTFLLIVSALLSYVLVRRIDSDLRNLGRVVAPLKEAVNDAPGPLSDIVE